MKLPLANPSLSQMARRLGVSCPKPPVQTEDGKIISFEDDGLKPKVVVHNPKDEVHDSVETSLEGIYHQSQLLNNMGGHAQQERMIYDKKRSLDKALLYSYSGDYFDINWGGAWYSWMDNVSNTGTFYYSMDQFEEDIMVIVPSGWTLVQSTAW